MLIRRLVTFNRLISYRNPAVWTQIRLKAKKAKNAEKMMAAMAGEAEVDLKKYDDSMKNTLEGLNNSYAKLRSGVPSPSLLDGKYCTFL